jgi:hypothetical protein
MTTDPEYTEKLAQLEDWFAPEDLDPELEAYLEEPDDEDGWTNLRHPLVYSIMYTPMLNKRLNLQLRQKQELLARSENEGDWHTFVYLHERPYRVQGFIAIADQLSDEEYWGLLASIWIDSENIRQNPEIWLNLLKADRGDSRMMMSPEDLDALNLMPDVIPVYQGHTDVRDDGWSWTTDRAIAEWFASRFANLESAEPVVSCGSVNRADVTAFLSNRGESEILVNRDKVRIHQTYKPSKAKTMASLGRVVQ